MSTTALKVYTLDEVKTHNKDGDSWLVIEDKVYDVSKFASLHPAGKQIILQYAGTDATEIFKYFHAAKAVLQKYEKLIIGQVTKDPKEPAPFTQFKTVFGEGVPFGDPN